MKFVRFVGSLGVLGVIGFGVYHVVGEYKLVSALDQAKKSVYSGKRESVVASLEKLALNENPEIAREAEDQLIVVYKDLGDQQGRTTTERASYYLKAQMIDPDCLTREQDTFVLEYRRFRH